MPVHRVPGGKSGTVYALREEIDAWLASSAAQQVTANGADDCTAEHPAGQLRPMVPWAIAIVAAAVVVTVVALWVAWRDPGGTVVPERAGLAGSQLTAWDAGGSVLWTKDLSPLVRLDAYLDGLAQRQPRPPWLHVPVMDVAGDEQPEILLLAADSRSRTTPRAQELLAVSSRGERLWTYRADGSFSFQGRVFTAPWMFVDLAAIGDPSPRTVWASLIHAEWWPSFVVRVDELGTTRLQFVNAGHLYDLATVPVEGRGTYVLAGGINNEYAAAAVAVVDAEGPPAVSPQTPGSAYACDDCPTGMPHRYIVFPRSAVGRLDDSIPYNRVWELRPQANGVEVQTTEYAARTATLTWVLTPDFEVETVRVPDSYVDAHDQLAREGRLDHSFDECPEYRDGLPVRVWAESTGWREYRVPMVRW